MWTGHCATASNGKCAQVGGWNGNLFSIVIIENNEHDLFYQSDKRAFCYLKYQRDTCNDSFHIQPHNRFED
jgi:hypothetical protein